MKNAANMGICHKGSPTSELCNVCSCLIWHFLPVFEEDPRYFPLLTDSGERFCDGCEGGFCNTYYELLRWIVVQVATFLQGYVIKAIQIKLFDT